MSGSRDKRVVKLELKRQPSGETLILWLRGPDEPEKKVIGRYFPEVRLRVRGSYSADG
jgi:hypothetical protein